MEKDLYITEEKTPDGIKFSMKGRVTSANAEELKYRLQKALDFGHKNIVLNMIWVEFLSSSGIRIILKAYQDANNAGGNFGIEMPSENVRNVLGMTALDELLIK